MPRARLFILAFIVSSDSPIESAHNS
jgi:hypothetical protein